MKFIGIATLALLAGCGSFPLGYATSTTRTEDQLQLDTLTCKDQAQRASDTAGREVGSFLLGLTIVGAPVAIAMDRAKQREVYAACMTAKGYTVTAP